MSTLEEHLYLNVKLLSIRRVADIFKRISLPHPNFYLKKSPASCLLKSVYQTFLLLSTLRVDSDSCLTAMIAERYIAIVHSFKYVRFLTSSRTVVIIASCWKIPFLFAICQTIIHLGSSEHFVADLYKFGVIYKMLFVLLSTIFLFVAHLHILLIACKLSREMKTLFKQVRFNIGANSVRTMEVRNVGLKTSTVRLVTKLVIIFISCYGLGIHNIICVYFNLCVPSKHEILAFRLLNLANSTLNPLVYAFLQDDIKRDSKALLCRRRKLKLRPFQVHPE